MLRWVFIVERISESNELHNAKVLLLALSADYDHYSISLSASMSVKLDEKKPTASQRIKTVVNKVVFLVIDLILEVFFSRQSCLPVWCSR